jgi:asparagine synthase (glutamine-hydrolysing)
VTATEALPRLRDQSVLPAWLAVLEECAPHITTRDGGGPRRQLRLEVPASGSPASFARIDSLSAVFDGVLYNRVDLMQSLGSRGTEANDAELILRAYSRWGEDTLHKLKGIFALILWDGARDLLLCARDRMGIYPLFYAETAGKLMASVSPQELIRQPGVSRAVNRAALAGFLQNNYPEPEETFFAQVKKVPPGHVMRRERGFAKVYRYWDPHPAGTPVKWADETEIEEFDRLFDQAVNRCVAFGRIAIYLSGGLDSVSVAGVAADQCRSSGLPDPLALSLVFPGEANEESVQRSVADQLGLPQILATMEEAGSANLLRAGAELSASLSAPLSNPWMPAYNYLALQSKQRGCQVILTGTGGDEWLAVSPLLAADLIRTGDVSGLYHLWNAQRRSHRRSPLRTVKYLLWTCAMRPLLGTAVRRVLQRRAPAILRARHRPRRPEWLAPDPALWREIEERAQRVLPFEQLDGNGYYVREMRSALDHPLVSLEAEEVFENGRRLGLRFLHPFLDADLVDLLYRIPPQVLNRGERSKGLVRASLARRFPHLGFERQRKILVTDFYSSVMRNEGPVIWRSLGGPRTLADLGIIDGLATESVIHQIFVNNPDEAFPVCALLNLETWLRPRV